MTAFESLHEIILTTDAEFNNPFWDVRASAQFTSPTGKTVHVEGFYAGKQQWRIRFVPREPGTWSYSATLTTPPHFAPHSAEIYAAEQGNFTCPPANSPFTIHHSPLLPHGYLRPSRLNPYRLEYEDRTPFYGVGVQTTGPINPDLDGPPLPTPPISPDSPRGRFVSAAEWCDAFKGAVNLSRIQFGQGIIAGHAQPIIPPKTFGKASNARQSTNRKYAQICMYDAPDRYDLELAAELDEVYKLHRGAGMSEILVFMQDMSAFDEQQTAFGKSYDTVNYKSPSAASMIYQEKYIRYIVARYAAFVDIWEIFNEDAYASPEYLACLHKIIRDADPYRHIISSNFSLYDDPSCEIIMPHEYVSIPATEVDAYLAKQIAAYKSFNKPIQYTEFGNKACLSNVDPDKWRIVLWTAYMNEVGILYWSMSCYHSVPKPGSTANANAYLGPDSRRHFRIFHKLTAELPQDMRPRMTHPGWVPFRSWALGNKNVTILYIHHYEDHATSYIYPPSVSKGLAVETSPGTFTATWTDPATGEEMMPPQTLTTRARLLIVPLPPITIDAVCLLKREAL
ncbi:MAG: DUF5060 domain-containing protein [Phycisphaerales bacterium]|nr:DUF5060 domain-containing protein [Phycisphaerales bacterium]